MNVPFQHKTHNWSLIPQVLLAIGFCWLVSKMDLGMTVILPMLPIFLVFGILIFNRFEWLIYGIWIVGFLISLFGRYLPGVPFGLSVDFFLVFLIVVFIFHHHVKWEGSFFTNPYILSMFIWLLYTIVELANPLAISKTAWFYANRGLSMYPIFIAVLTIYVARHHSKSLQVFLIIWAVFSLFGTLWGMKQLFLGVSATEHRWLMNGAASTHILFGKLRIFSYYSDAAQFGASQAHTGLVFGLIGIFPGKLKYRWLYLLVAALSFYGMLISGTRGALAIPALGGMVYLILTKNFKILSIGILAGLLAFGFLKYTTIGQSNYQINRMRTALDPDDPSLRVRKERNQVLSHYMADKPLGGGIGSAGFWGKRFTPGTFLAELGTDGHYTRIWMESGIIGLYLYLGMLGTIALVFGWKLWRMPDGLERQTFMGFYTAYIGLCMASYTNGLMVQNPTGPLLFSSLAFIFIGTRSAVSKKRIL